jgi:hypothetical protein
MCLGLLKWFSKVNYLLECRVGSWHQCCHDLKSEFLIAVYLCKYIIVEHKLIDSGYVFITTIDQSKNYIKWIGQ